MTTASKTVALALRGPSWRDDLTLREQHAVADHLSFMVDLLRKGILEAAGPFVTADEHLDGDLVGLVVFAESDVEEARRVLEDDPARVAGTMRYEVLEWYR